MITSAHVKTTIFFIAFALLFVLYMLINGCAHRPSSPLEHGTPLLVRADGGRTWNIFGLQIVGKIMAKDTNGQYSVVYSTTPPNSGPPIHVHKHEDEAFYVLEGHFSFTCGEQRFIAQKGDIVSLPRGIPHGFKNIGDSPGMLINTITPGGFEEFFEEIDQLPKVRPIPPATVVEIAKKYGLTFIPSNN